MSEIAEYQALDDEGGAKSLPDARTHHSGLISQVLEYRFLAEVTAGLMRRGQRFEVLRGDFDLDGHDVVIEAGGILRHIQLKAMTRTGKKDSVGVSMRLAAKPSGCVIWMSYDPGSFHITRWRWYGPTPAAPITDLGNLPLKHTRGNQEGRKAVRKNMRTLRATAFIDVPDVGALVHQLFGPAGAAEFTI